MDRFGKVLLPFEKEFKNVFARASACLSDSSLCDSTNLKIFFLRKNPISVQVCLSIKSFVSWSNQNTMSIIKTKRNLLNFGF